MHYAKDWKTATYCGNDDRLDDYQSVSSRNSGHGGFS
jgi:hypothetical protein